MILTLQNVLNHTYLLDTAELLNDDQAEFLAGQMLQAVQDGTLKAVYKPPASLKYAGWERLADELSTKHGQPLDTSVISALAGYGFAEEADHKLGLNWLAKKYGIPAHLLVSTDNIPLADWLITIEEARDYLRTAKAMVRGLTLLNVYMLNPYPKINKTLVMPFIGELLTLSDASERLARAGLPSLSERQWLTAASAGTPPLWWRYEGDVTTPTSPHTLRFVGHLKATNYLLRNWLDGVTPKNPASVRYPAINERTYRIYDNPEITPAMMRIRPSDLQALLKAAMETPQGEEMGNTIRKEMELLSARRENRPIDEVGKNIAGSGFYIRMTRLAMIRDYLYEHGIEEPVPNEHGTGKPGLRSRVQKHFGWTDYEMKAPWKQISKQPAKKKQGS